MFKKLCYKVKSAVMPTICKAIGNIRWYPPITGKELLKKVSFYKKSGVIRSLSSIEDVFRGNYKGITYEIVDTYLAGGQRNYKIDLDGYRVSYDGPTFFDGIIVSLDMNKRFYSHTVIKENCESPIPPVSGLVHTTLEDVDFEGRYDVFTNDETEARYLITPTFMERFKEIKETFKAYNVECAFYKGKVILALDIRRDLFEFKSLSETLLNERQYKEIFDDIISVFKLIDHLKLNLKIGL